MTGFDAYKTSDTCEAARSGYFTTFISTTGEGNIRAHGFTKAEVTRMKKMILEKI